MKNILYGLLLITDDITLRPKLYRRFFILRVSKKHIILIITYNLHNINQCRNEYTILTNVHILCINF